jgi:LPXTG-motif cell wall-anchored protein
MKFFEPKTGGRQIITYIVFGVVALLVLGALGTGAGSYLYNLANPNTTLTTVILMSGTILPILWFVAIALKFI